MMEKVYDIGWVLFWVGLVAGTIAVISWQGYSLTEARKEAVEAYKKAEAYKGSLESLKASVEAQEQARKKAAQVYRDRKIKAEAEAKAARKEKHELDKALEASPAWGSTPIPAGVRDVLDQGGS